MFQLAALRIYPCSFVFYKEAIVSVSSPGTRWSSYVWQLQSWSKVKVHLFDNFAIPPSHHAILKQCAQNCPPWRGGGRRPRFRERASVVIEQGAMMNFQDVPHTFDQDCRYEFVLCAPQGFGWLCAGSRRFSDDIEFMTGSRPGYFWVTCWMFVTPVAMLTILIANIVLMSKGDAVYYAWSEEMVMQGIESARGDRGGAERGREMIWAVGTGTNYIKQLQVYFTSLISFPARQNINIFGHVLLLVCIWGIHTKSHVCEKLASDRWCLRYGTTCKIHL